MKIDEVKIFIAVMFAASIPLCISAQSLDLGNAANANADNMNAALIMTANSNDDTNINIVATDDATSTAEVTDNIEAGILPDSHWYVLKQWWEDVRMTFTFSSEKKAQLEYQYALQRLAEAREMYAKGQPEQANTLLQRFEVRMQKFEQRATRLSESTGNRETWVDSLKTLQEKQQMVLESAYAQAPSEFKNIIIEAMSRSATGLEDAISKVQGNSEANEFMNTVESRVGNMGEEIQVRLQTMLQQHANETEETETDPVDVTINSNTAGNTNQVQNQNGNNNQAQNQNMTQNQNQVRIQNQNMTQNQNTNQAQNQNQERAQNRNSTDD